MPRPNTLLVRSYFGCRLEVQDDGGEGWIVRVHDTRGVVSCTLRNRVSNGLEPLLAEARRQVDRAIAQGRESRGMEVRCPLNPDVHVLSSARRAALVIDLSGRGWVRLRQPTSVSKPDRDVPACAK